MRSLLRHIYEEQQRLRIQLEENQEKGIYTNSGVKPYNQPTADKKQERQHKLEKWNNEIDNLEKEATQYCENIGFHIT